MFIFPASNQSDDRGILFESRKAIVMMKRLVPVFVILLVVLSGCEEKYEAPADQPVFFEYRYVNHAWGYSEHGYLIDSDGDVRRFDSPEDFRLPDSTGYISRADLLHNLTQTDSIIHHIIPKDLEKHTALISGAAEGKTGEAENIAADAGSFVHACYLYDSQKDKYQYIFLASSGDWQQSNEAPQAETLVTWLKGIVVFRLAL